jgi:hypothetical protein
MAVKWKRRQVRNLEAANFKNPTRALDNSIAPFDSKDAVPRLFLTEMSRNTRTTQMSEAFLRIIGKLMTFTTENRDPLHCPPSRNSAVRWVEIQWRESLDGALR